jgi:hypothetical protein
MQQPEGAIVPEWQAFERRVAEAYRMLGARVEHDRLIGGHQVDVVVHETTQSGSVVIRAVDAKQHARATGIEAVNAFVRIASRLREARLIDVATVVSSHGFTRQARDAGTAGRVELLEISDLEQRVFQRMGSTDRRDPHDPFGFLDQVHVVQGRTRVRGWAIDPDTTDPIEVAVIVDGQHLGNFLADRERTDVEKIHDGFGAAHGFSIDLDLPPGTYTVAVSACNVGPGTDRLLGVVPFTL